MSQQTNAKCGFQDTGELCQISAFVPAEGWDSRAANLRMYLPHLSIKEWQCLMHGRRWRKMYFGNGIFRLLWMFQACLGNTVLSSIFYWISLLSATSHTKFHNSLVLSPSFPKYVKCQGSPLPFPAVNQQSYACSEVSTGDCLLIILQRDPSVKSFCLL